MNAPVILVLSDAPRALGEHLKALLGGALHGRRGRVADPDVFFDDAGAELRALFTAGRPIVAVMAAGAAIRALAPVLADKGAEPPVVVLAEDGSVAVPLLGGHRGANDLARRIGEATGAVAAVTTAGDLRFGVALDAPPDGYLLENVADAKAVMAELLAGAEAWIEGEADWLRASNIPLADDGRVTLSVTEELRATRPFELLYRPKTLVLGIGTERGAPAEEAIALAEQVVAEAGVSPLALACIASIDLKADEPAVHAVAEHFGVPARFFDAATLEAETPRLANRSDLVFRETGCHGVSEGAALACAGPAGALLQPKQKGARVTAALARSPRPIDPGAVGRARGTLFVVGIGPGSPAWRSPEATRMLAASSDLVGYSLYLDLLGPLARAKARHDFPLGAEETRARHALELAGEGRTVSLVCSGDPGIYAMGSLVFELLDRGDLTDSARRVAVTVAPGISALQAAAARVGAPLGHDFCAISLSDLLTPADVIRRRVAAAAEADFAVAFYNPVSQRRRTLLIEARDALLRHRPADTPVVLASNLGREDERVRIVPLADLDVTAVDMLTTVIVGSSQTRRFTTGEGRHLAYTPRGYAAKAGSGLAAEAGT